jgi:hypothetical protein
VPHWLYFTALREIQPLWYNLVVYASLLGVFLTVTGIYVGLRQYGRGGKHTGQRSPYRGLKLWHHWTGLIFGIFTLTWVASGLVSMNPWGWLESDGLGAEARALAGRPLDAGDVAALVAALSQGPLPAGVVRADLTVQDGRAWALLSDRAGESWRASLPGLTAAPPALAELAAKGRAARPGVGVAEQGLIHEEDAYHYAHKSEVVLPAWRVIYADEEATRLYLDPRTGEGLHLVDAEARAFRWLHLGLHRMDFAGFLRARPMWDLLTLPLLLGVTFLCAVGCWLGWRRATGKRKRSGR